MAGVYSIDIPSSAPLANILVNAAAFAPAPAILLGTARTLEDVMHAQDETLARKRMKQANDVLVTADEISLSAIREAAVTAEYVAGRYAAGAPAWGIALAGQLTTLSAQPAQVTAVEGQLTALTGRVDVIEGQLTTLSAQVTAVGGQVTAVEGQVTAVERRLTAVEGRLTDLTGRVDLIDARQRHQFAQRRNKHINEADPYQQLVKINVGIGPPLPGRAPRVPAVPDADVGALYPVAEPFVPGNMIQLIAMSHDDISALAEWANDSFGIGAADNIAACRIKLMNHYSSE